MKTSTLPVTRPSYLRAILTGAILPVTLISSARAVTLLPPNLTLNSDNAAPIYIEGLKEGFVNLPDNETTANPVNGPDNGQGPGISLGLRMAQSTLFGPTAWANNRTWIYTGEVFTGPNGIISFAANNDDTDWLSINGVVVLNDNAWDTAVGSVTGGLTPNTWVPFEYRVSDGGAGGAGPSGQNINGASGWTASMGALMSYSDEFSSNVATNYIGGPGDLGAPTEVANGTPTLFRFQNGFGFADDLVVQNSATITIDGSNATLAELSLRFDNITPATLTINDGVGSVHKTLSINGTTQWATFTSGGAAVTIDGTSDFRPAGIQKDNGQEVTVRKDGAGALILDTFNANSTLDSTTFEAGTGKIILSSANGQTPVPGAKFNIAAGGVLRVGSPSGTGNFNNAIRATGTGTLEHTANTIDTLSGALTVNANQVLTINVADGRLYTAAGVTASGAGAGIIKTGTGLLRSKGAVTVRNLTVSNGRYEILGAANLVNVPVLNGGTLALLNTSGANQLPNPFVLSGTGALEARGGGLGSGVNATALELTTGSTFRLAGNTGLQGYFYGGDDGGAQGAFGGPQVPTNTYTQYVTYFNNRGVSIGAGGLEAISLTSAGETELLNFNSSGVDAAMYAVFGQTRTNNIVSRMVGKIYIAQDGMYNFRTTSDDGSMLYVDGVAVVNNNASQGMTPRTGVIALTAGLHDIDIGYYEGGGGNGLIVDWSGPGFNTFQNLPNSVLSPNMNPEVLPNAINVSGTSTLNVVAANSQITGNVTIQNGVTLNLPGNHLTMDNVVLPTSGGTYTFNVGSEVTISHVTDNGNPVTIQKNGGGVLVIDNTGAAHLQNPASIISVNQGSLGVLLGAPTSPTGNATINFNGGGVVLSSKNGNQTYTIPNFAGSANLEARKLGTGVAGTPEVPIEITLLGNLNVANGNTLTLGTADNYVEKISGTASGSGTVAVNGGTITATTANALKGLKVNFTKLNTTGTVNLQTNSPVVGSVGNVANANGSLVVGDGNGGAAVLTFDGSVDAKFTGAISGAGIGTFSVDKAGSGRQSILGTSNATSYTVHSGILELGSLALADSNVPLNLTGGAFQFANQGLLLRIYDTDPNLAINGAPGAYSGILNTLPGVLQRYTALGAPSITTLTSANNNLLINYNPGGGAEAPFAVHGQTDADTIEAVFTGYIDVPTAGAWTFDPRSDDGTNVFVDGQLVSNNNLPQGIGHVPRPGTINLSEGRHSLVITFNEGTGGAGMYVNVTPPGGSPQLLANNILLSPGINATNPVNVTGSGAINPNNGDVILGNLTQASTATLSAAGGGLLQFPQTTPTGGNSVSFNAGSGTTIRPGQVLNATTLNASGSGNVLIDFSGPQFFGGAVNINGGNVVVAQTQGGANPISTAVVNLSGGGAFRLSAAGTGDNFTYTNTVNVGVGGGSIQAGRFTYGPVGTFTMTYGSPINIANGAPLGLAAFDNYQLELTSPINSNGAISSTAGAVKANAALTGTTLAVTGGTLDTSGTLSFNGGVTVATNSTLRLNGNSYTGGAVNVSGTLNYNGNGTALPATFNQGRLLVSSGVVDYNGGAIVGSAVTTNTQANQLSARAYKFVNPAGGFGTTEGLRNTLNATADFTVPLQQPLNFGPAAQADPVYNTFFGGQTGDAFTAVFLGKFTAPASGNPGDATAVYTFGRSINDDSASIWIDLNQNGLFEQNGSAGDERIQHANCCSGGTPDDTFNTSVNLVPGQSYRMAFVAEDTGGGSSFAAKWGLGNPGATGGLANFVDPASQPGVWSFESSTGGAKVEIAGGNLRAGNATNTTDIALTGDTATFTLNSPTPVTTLIDVLRSTAGTEATPTGFEVTTGNTATVAHLTVGPGNYLVKSGGGAVNISGLSVGSGGTLEIAAGVVTYTGSGQASVVNFAGNNGGIVVGGSGVFDLEGVLSGSVTLKQGGGTLRGAGTVGTILANSGGTISPGNTLIGTIKTTGDLLLLDGSTVKMDLGTVTASDALNIAGTVFLSESPGPTLTLALAPTFSAAIDAIFPLVINDLDDPVTGHFANLTEGASINLGVHTFQISYVANVDGGVVGNDIALRYVVPEPGAVALLLGGFGMLIGAQRLRRRK